jgi:hypothetical protein
VVERPAALVEMAGGRQLGANCPVAIPCRCRTLAIATAPGRTSSCDLRPSHFPDSRRFRSRARRSLATVMALSNCATAAKDLADQHGCGAVVDEGARAVSGDDIEPWSRNMRWPVSCTMRSRANRLAVSKRLVCNRRSFVVFILISPRRLR